MGRGIGKRLEDIETEKLGILYMDLFHEVHSDEAKRKEHSELRKISKVLSNRDFKDRMEVYYKIIARIIFNENRFFKDYKIYCDMRDHYHMHIIS